MFFNSILLYCSKTSFKLHTNKEKPRSVHLKPNSDCTQQAASIGAAANAVRLKSNSIDFGAASIEQIDQSGGLASDNSIRTSLFRE